MKNYVLRFASNLIRQHVVFNVHRMASKTVNRMRCVHVCNHMESIEWCALQSIYTPNIEKSHNEIGILLAFTFFVPVHVEMQFTLWNENTDPTNDWMKDKRKNKKITKMHSI